MADLLPILTGLVVITALAVVSSNEPDNKKEIKKEEKEYKKEHKKENKNYDNKKYDNKKDDLKLNELVDYFKKNLTSSKRKQKRYRLLRDSKGKTVKNSKGQKQYILSSKTV